MEEIKNVDESVIDSKKTDEEIAEEARLAEEAKAEELKQGQDAPTDTEVELAAVKVKLIETEKERDNYKTGLLKEKGKITEDDFINDENRETVDAVIDKKVKIALLDNQIIQDRQKEQELISKIVKENKELRVALKSKSQPTGASRGSGSEEEGKNKEFFTEEQKAEIFKKFPNIAKNPKGLETLKANIIKNRTK